MYVSYLDRSDTKSCKAEKLKELCEKKNNNNIVLRKVDAWQQKLTKSWHVRLATSSRMK